jgi:DsbC/DsbD-like thiol-disulfide interchange protein
MIHRIAIVAALLVLGTAAGNAASSTWHEAAGARVRLVTVGQPDADGKLRGAVQIDLQPGWKTYWRDPGGSGVPPVFDLPASGGWASALLDFPAPQRHNDESGSWAGYDYPVSLPVTLTAEPGQKPTSIEGSVFLGVCEKICVPLQAPISVKLDMTATPPDETAVVEAAWAALPAPATEVFGVTASSLINDPATGVIVSGTAKAQAEASDFFLAGEDGYLFGDTTFEQLNDQIKFSVKIITQPKTKPTGAGLHYTLVTKQGAAAGTIPYP